MAESLASITVGEHAYPYKVEPRCRACSSPGRLAMEKALVRGWTYERIVEEHGTGGVSARSLRNHVSQGHVPIHAPAVRKAVEEHSQSVSAALAPAIEATAANLSFAHAVVERVRRRLDDGEIEPTVRDGLAAARLIADSDAGSDPAAVEEWQDQLIATLEMVREIMSPEQFADLAARLNDRSRRVRQGSD